MTDPLKEQLLQAICDAVDDDAPRLVYADYLLSQPDQESQLRGKLIMYHCGPIIEDEVVRLRVKRKMDRTKNHCAVELSGVEGPPCGVDAGAAAAAGDWSALVGAA